MYKLDQNWTLSIIFYYDDSEKNCGVIFGKSVALHGDAGKEVQVIGESQARWKFFTKIFH